MTESSSDRAIAIVGVGAILPDAPDVSSFWANLKEGRYSISDVTDRWAEGLYFDTDRGAPDKTYSKIGGWVRDYDWDPMKWRMPIPPKVGEVMDPAQKWAVAASREALLDFGFPERPIDRERTAVIMGNALGGDFHLRSAARILFPEVGDELTKAPSFQALPEDVRSAVMEELVAGVRSRIPNITEDTMPGELGNIVAGRVAALYDLKGPNYIADAACASAMAAMSAAAEGLRQNEYDAVLTGGIDANMSASTFVKFSKIGALSATGTRPYAAGADGFVMGEGAAVFLLKRLEDAERDGDKIYAVMLATGGSSDGKGKGITAPNPVGQRFAVERAWKRAGVEPTVGDMVEGHGTSTKVGDVVEVESLGEVFRQAGLPVGSLPLGSVKSNIGHLKGAAGAAGVLKATLALHHKMLPPSVNFDTPNPNIDFTVSPFRVNTELRGWEKPGSNGDAIRRAGVSAFGFGGTNFHVVLEEHVPGRHRPRRAQVQGAELATPTVRTSPAKVPLRGALVVGGINDPEVAVKLRKIAKRAEGGEAPLPAPPAREDLDAPVRIAIDYGDAAELADRCAMAVKALENGDDRRFRALRNKGVFLGRGAPGKVAFLFTGQGSQYVGMLGELRDREPIVEATFEEADQVMTPLLGGPLTERIFVDSDDPQALAEAEQELKQTAVTQPAVLTVDSALTRLYSAYGVEPDFVMGHSLGEYGALVAAGGMPFGDALTAVAARGDAMTRLALEDNGLMAAVFGPVEEVTRLVESVDGYVVVANVNSTKECVIGGATEAVQNAMEQLKEAGYRNVQLPVSHAFHTRIVEPAAEPLRDVLRGLQLTAPRIPVVANVDASFYPTGSDASEKMIEILGLQIGSPVQFVKGLDKLYEAGARVFVEMGPKRALYGMADDVVGGRDGVTVLFTNHPRTPDLVAVNRTLCGLYALGLGNSAEDVVEVILEQTVPAAAVAQAPAVAESPRPTPNEVSAAGGGEEDRYVTLGRMFADFMDKSFDVYSGGHRERAPVRVGITGAALGLPGAEKVFDDGNLGRILQGEGFIKPVPEELRDKVLDRRITRLVKGPNGEARFETVTDPEEVIKLAGRAGEFDFSGEFGYPEDRVTALDRVTHLAIAAGIDALRDAGIPLVRRYKDTTTGSKLPVGWSLPEEMRDDTGVIFGSAFPGYDQLIQILEEYHEDRSRRVRLEELKALQFVVVDGPGKSQLAWRIAQLEEELGETPYQFDRRFLFQVLNMGHAQFAEYIGARGANTGINGACATGTQGVAMAQDWVQNGRCRRVIVVTGDDVNTENMFPWFASGFVAAGVAATDAKVEDAALPFDRRRHGLIMGMGGSALVVEDLAAAAERGVGPICEILGSVVANSAYHGSRLDVPHIVGVMEKLVSQVEAQWGIDRYEIAPETVFVSHETYTPARGGSASAEVHALRKVFGEHTDSIVVANTKGYTGHAMAVAIEDTLAVKILETGIVPPVANYREVDPELGTLNLSKGGSYPVQYALRLAAGFGSQICMSLSRWAPPPDGARRAPDDLGFQHRIADPGVWEAWLRRVTGYEAPELEIVQRTLRLKDHGPPMPVQVVPETTAAVAAPPPAVPAPPVVAVPAPPLVRPAQEPTAATVEQASTIPDAGGAPDSAPQELAWTSGPSVVSPPEAARLRSPAGAGGAEEGAPQDPVAVKVLAIVAEQTGYPPDMLALDLDLEADLGIDTVKQAEMFAAIRGAYDIERDDNLALRDYPTLARAIEFVYEKRPDLTASTVAAAAVTIATAATVDLEAGGAPDTAPQEPALRSPAGAGGAEGGAPQDPVAVKVLAIVSEQTGYPPDMLELDLDLEADLGIDTVKQAEMFAAIRGAYDIERDDDLALRDYPTLARAIEFVYEKRPDLTIATVAAAAATIATAATVDLEAGGAPDTAPQEPALRSPAGEGEGADSAPQDPVAVKVLAIVSEQTGYPPDMLELDLDLEADLGIDTVKQAEMFAAIRGAYDIERDDDLALRDYPTLARAIEFVYEKRPDLVGATGATAAGATAAGVAAVVDTAGELVLDLRDLAPAPEPAAGTVEPAPAIPDASQDPVAQKVLEIVAEQTGYPHDMLELDLDLEADLGIDTVKQAEMFAAIREAYGIERDDDLALRDYPTLARAIDFVYEKRPDLDPASAPTVEPEVEEPTAEEVTETEPAGTELAETALALPVAEHVGEKPEPTRELPWRGSMEAAQSVPRRVPVARLRPAIERFPESAVKLGHDARVVVVPDEGGVGVALAERLGKNGVDVLIADPSLDTDHLVAEVMDWRADGFVTGLYWLPAMDAVLAPELADPEDRQEALRRRVKALHALARALYDDLGGAGRFLVSGVRLGGRHGYEPEGAIDDAGGAVTGFTKAFARERPEALVKAVDFEASRKTAKLAAVLIAETLRDPGVVEIGHAEGRRWAVGLEEQPVEPGEPLGSESVYLVTGAAGSIVSAVLTDLSEDGGTYWLLDLADEPDEEDPDLDRVDTDRDGLRRDIFARMQADGERVTPVQVEKELVVLEREEAARGAIRAIRNAGGTVHYRSLDLRDSEAVSAVVREIVAEHGRVDALIHAAGVEISRSLPDKSEEEFALVFDVKVEGWYNLLTALGDTPLGSVMTFSSIAGRFGNAGQTDYAAANDLLCKAVSSMRRSRPDTCAVSLDWTAWGEIGMAARGSIPTIMRAAGIDMLSPDAGIATVRRELTAGTQGEAVIAQGLGIMLSESADEARFDPRFHDSSVAAAGPMVERVRSVSLFDGMVVERELDPKAQPFLDHHRIDGTAVLPGVMGLEAMAEAARLPFPDLHVAALEDVDFHAPFKFYRDEPRTVTVRVHYEADGSDVVAECRLSGTRMLVGRDEPEETIHFTGRVRLVSEAPDEPRTRTVPPADGEMVVASTIYDTYFHGPAYQVLEGAWGADGVVAGRMAEGLPANHEPAERPTLVAPRMVELAFQTAGLAEIADSARMGLPFGFRRLELAGAVNGEVESTAVVEATDDGAFDVDVANADGQVVLSLRGYRTSALPGEVSGEAFGALRT